MRAVVTALSDAEIAERVGEAPGWAILDGMLRRTFSFKNFREAVGFVVHIGMLAEKADHHPDIDIRYKVVSIALATHSAGGISQMDFDLAAAINLAVGPYS